MFVYWTRIYSCDIQIRSKLLSVLIISDCYSMLLFTSVNLLSLYCVNLLHQPAVIKVKTYDSPKFSVMFKAAF